MERPARDLEAHQAQQLGLTYVLLNGMAFSTFQYSTLESAGPERRVPYQQEGSTPRKAEHGPRHIQRAVESRHARDHDDAVTADLTPYAESTGTSSGRTEARWSVSGTLSSSSELITQINVSWSALTTKTCQTGSASWPHFRWHGMLWRVPQHGLRPDESDQRP